MLFLFFLTWSQASVVSSAVVNSYSQIKEYATDREIVNYRSKVEYAVGEVRESREDGKRIKHKSKPVIRRKESAYNAETEKHKDYSHRADSGGKLVFGKRGHEKSDRYENETYEKERDDIAEKLCNLKRCVRSENEEVKRGENKRRGKDEICRKEFAEYHCGNGYGRGEKQLLRLYLFLFAEGLHRKDRKHNSRENKHKGEIGAYVCGHRKQGRITEENSRNCKENNKEGITDNAGEVSLHFSFKNR